MSERATRVFSEILSSLLISAIGVLVAGIFLGGMSSHFVSIPGLIVLVPALLNLRGCIASSLAMRLGTAIHLGVIGHKSGRDELRRNIIASILLTIITSIFIGVLADFTCRFLDLPSAGIILLTSISLLSGTLAGLLVIGITVLIAIYSSAKGLDPDNVTIPLVSTLGDILATLCMFLVVIILVGLGLIAYL